MGSRPSLSPFSSCVCPLRGLFSSSLPFTSLYIVRIYTSITHLSWTESDEYSSERLKNVSILNISGQENKVRTVKSHERPPPKALPRGYISQVHGSLGPQSS